MAPPSEWGPPAWAFIFAVIDEMPEYPRNRDHYAMFFESLKGVLPCEKCRYHYTRHMELNPPPVWSREATREWAHHLRQQIHQRNKEQQHHSESFLNFFKF